MLNCDRIRYINYYRFTSANSLEVNIKCMRDCVHKLCPLLYRNPLGGGGGGGNSKLNQTAFHTHESSKVVYHVDTREIIILCFLVHQNNCIAVA